LAKSAVKATFFTTHETDMNKEIVVQGHELGIHPNFLPGGSHGQSTHEIIESCLEWAPNARYMRTHALVQSTPLLCDIFSTFTQLTTDVSLLMHGAKYVQRCEFKFEGVCFERILYNWEDDAEFYNQRFGAQDTHFFGPLTIFDFHPIHVHLNSNNVKNYTRLKDHFIQRALSELRSVDIEPYVNPNEGAGTFLQSILCSNAESIQLGAVK